MPRSRAQKRYGRTTSSSPFDDLICFNLYRGWREIQEFYAQAFPAKLNAQRMYVMRLCLQEEPVSVSTIAGVLGIDDAAVSNLLRRMEGDGLIVRTRSATDGRGMEIKASAAGRRSAERTEERLRILDDQLYEKIPVKDRKTLRRIVQIVQESAHETPP